MKISKDNYEAFFLDYYEGTLSVEKVAELMLFLEQNPQLKNEFENFENISLNDLEDDVKFENKELLKKGTVTPANFDDMAVSFIEGKLSDGEEKDLLKFIEANPEFKIQLELFRKTILPVDEKIIFENKSGLKKQTESLSEKELLLLSSIEGMITFDDTKKLDVIISKDADLKKELEQFKRTKLSVDSSVVFPDKDSLKRREPRVVPFYYYVAAAASVALLFGFYFLSGSGQNKGTQFSFNKKEFIFKKHSAPQESLQVPNKIATIKDNKIKKNNSVILTNEKIIIKKNENILPENKKQDDVIIVKNDIKTPDTSVQHDVIVKNDHPVNYNKQNILVNSFADQDDSPIRKNNNEYFTLGEALAYKAKSKMLKDEMSDNASYKEDKKRITWYDAVLVMMKGIRGLTGRELDVRKKYNENNELIAYEFIAGNHTFTKPVTKKL